jgi:methenyltetrahydromethanopterin cyclohydrolase
MQGIDNMKFAMFFGTLLMATSLFAQSTESESAKLPLQNYLRAHETGDADFMRKAFSSDAKVVGYMGGKMIVWSVDDYARRFSGKPAADEALRKRRFEVIDMTGDAAVARVVLDYPTVKFVDYMSLLKVDGEWKIIHKSFNAQLITP